MSHSLFPEVTRQASEREGCSLIVKPTGKRSLFKFYLLALRYCFGFGGSGSGLLFVALFLRQSPRLASDSERYACLFLSSSFLSSSSLSPFSQWSQRCHGVALLLMTRSVVLKT